MQPNESLQPDKVLAMLGELAQASESDTARISAAKILLDRLAPKKEDDEAKRNEAAERDRALAEARALLADLAVIKLAHYRLSLTLAQAGEAAATDPAG
ncbi:MAG: hypothetical protein P4M13_04860 [Alphaproteobacteria bacterium]|nr:hypothetical protein [Alphaproteobacteria bacterium]